MRVHKITLVDSAYHIDLDHIQMVCPPEDGRDGYGFYVWLAFRDKPIFITTDSYQYAAVIRTSWIDKAFAELYLAWSGKIYEQDTAST
jgi:hypothetical protein